MVHPYRRKVSLASHLFQYVGISPTAGIMFTIISRGGGGGHVTINLYI